MFSAKRLLNKIRAFRKDNRITQIAFAKQIGISVSTLVNWERERRDFNPTLTQIINMAKIFGVTPGGLLLQGGNAVNAYVKNDEKKQSKRTAKTSLVAAVKETKAKKAGAKEETGKAELKTLTKKKVKASAVAVVMPDIGTKQEKKRGRPRKQLKA